ncbi:MAG: choice-of-anchor tandem repeat GloVer-containing protein [Verrucomicrobiota bacterium]
MSGDTLYGTAFNGGSFGLGTVFALNTDGSAFKTIHSFFVMPSNFAYSWTNSDGVQPDTALILSGNTLYGTASAGGIFGNGTVFKLNTNGSGFTILYSLTLMTPGTTPLNVTGTTNIDGTDPSAGFLSGNTLYGTASRGGMYGYGTVFSISIPVPPELTINVSGTDVILTWPTNATGYALESTTNLFPAFWITNADTPVFIRGQNTVTNSILGKEQFYRLIQ